MFTERELENIGRNSAELVHDELQENFYNRKRGSLLLADSYRRIAGEYDAYDSLRFNLLKRAERVRGCSSYLEYRIDLNRLNDPDFQRLSAANFCGDQMCPLCSWRKARKLANQLKEIMELLGKSHRFIFLTLTVKGVNADGLDGAIDRMLRESWHGLINGRSWKKAVRGYFRSVEVTHDAEPTITKAMFKRKRDHYLRTGLKAGDANPSYGLYKPHMHAILAVEPSYFSKSCKQYLSQKDVRILWRKALDADYDPYVHVEAIYGGKSGRKGNGSGDPEASAVLEAAKYAVKSGDYLVRGPGGKTDEARTDEAVRAISSSIAKRRLVGFGGVFREAHRELHLSSDDGDLLHVGTENTSAPADYLTIRCVWSGKGGYRVTSDAARSR